MLKKRIIALLPVKNNIVVQSIGFGKYLPVGSPKIAVEFLNKWGIDEIIYTDITARKSSSPPNFRLIKEAAGKCYVPMAIGGGIRNLTDVEELMHCGADKVTFNRALFDQLNLITDVAKKYGDQCAVVSIDAIKTDSGYKVYNYINQTTENITPEQAAKIATDAGAGEILINAVHKDGKYTGYDIELVNAVCGAVNVPVIAAGGAKNAGDMITLLESTNVSAACAGNFFHFTEHSVNITKRQIINKTSNIRLETHANYAENKIGTDGRILKKEDNVLEHLLYIKIEKEVI